MATMMEEMGDEGNEELTQRIEKFGNNAAKYVENVALGKTEREKYTRQAQVFILHLFILFSLYFEFMIDSFIHSLFTIISNSWLIHLGLFFDFN